MAHIVLLGAEGLAEARDVAWLRDATREEVLDTFGDRGGPAVDGIGRPYFAVAILDDAPAEVLERAARYKRMRYLYD